MENTDKKTPPIKEKRKGKGIGTLWIVIICIAILALIGSLNSSNNSNLDKSVAVKSYDLPRDTAYEKIVAEKKARYTTENSETVKRLSKVATFKTDEFKGITWIKPKSKPAYRNMNGIYCYFSQEGNQVSNFRFVIQYLSDDWLFIQNYRFVIDGQPFSYTPRSVERDNADGDIWEWSDENVAGSNVSFVEALASAKTAKIRFEGSQYYKEKTVTPAQLKSIKDMYTLYKAMGGTF